MNYNPPLHCGNGHELLPGKVKVGWGPCSCTRAVPQPRGHTEMTCLVADCGWMYRENGCDFLKDGFPVSGK